MNPLRSTIPNARSTRMGTVSLASGMPVTMESDADEETHALSDRLYALPREEFVAERDKLARQLKRDGDADAAAEVRALRKPTAVAWLTNQLAREQPGDVAALIETGERVRRAQESAIGGGEGAALRDAAKELRSAIDGLVKKASQLRGAKASALSDLPATLQAAATDPDGQRQLRAGRLVDAARSGRVRLGRHRRGCPRPFR